MEKGTHVRLKGPNGIGKTTLLEGIVTGQNDGIWRNPKAEIGYYRQDFHNLDFNESVISCLRRAADDQRKEQEIRYTAASFLLKGDTVNQPIGTLSEGQKGLLSFASLVLQEPAILIVDEPTNHINFTRNIVS